VADGYTLQAAHGNVGVHAATGGDHPQAGGQVGEILQIDDALLLDLHGAEGGDRDRHGLGTFIAAAGGDHDFVQGANGGASFNLYGALRPDLGSGGDTQGRETQRRASFV